MASSPSPAPPPPAQRPCRDLGSAAAVTSTPPSTGKLAAPISPSKDVIFEILSWLPTKSLCRFRCVSNEWRALVSSTSFIAAQRSRAEPLIIARSTCYRAMQLMDTEGTAVRVLEDPNGDWIFRASLGDLVCFSYSHGNSGTRVVDLATGKTLLAYFESLDGGHIYYTGFGFGRAAQSGSLKVFRLFLAKLGEQICEVLTMGDAPKWRRTRSPPTMVSTCYTGCSGVAVNGALNFLSRKGGEDVLSFDLDSEKWKVIHGPGALDDKEDIGKTIAELNGTLCIAQMVQSVINVWLLGDSRKKFWTKAYTMDPVLGFVVPLRVLRSSGELLFCHYYFTWEPILRVYDPRSGKSRDVKTPTKLIGRVGLCSSNLDHRFRGLDVDASDLLG